MRNKKVLFFRLFFCEILFSFTASGLSKGFKWNELRKLINSLLIDINLWYGRVGSQAERTWNKSCYIDAHPKCCWCWKADRIYRCSRWRVVFHDVTLCLCPVNLFVLHFYLQAVFLKLLTCSSPRTLHQRLQLGDATSAQTNTSSSHRSVWASVEAHCLLLLLLFYRFKI